MRRLLPTAAAIAMTLTACSLAFPFDVSREVALTGPGGDATWNEPVDLSENDSLWSHRDALTSVSVSSVTVTVRSVGADNAAGSVQFSLALRPDGAPADGSGDLSVVKNGTLKLAAGEKFDVAGSAALDDLLMSAVQGDGRFTLVAHASASAAVDANVVVSIAGSVEVDLVKK
jgi:hypothetical protein